MPQAVRKINRSQLRQAARSSFSHQGGGPAGGAGAAGITARGFRIRSTVNNDPNFCSIAEMQWLTNSDDTAQPTTGTPYENGAAGDLNTAAAAFDGNTGTYYAFAPGADTTADGSLGYIFDTDVTVSFLKLTVRTSSQIQSPRSFVIDTYNGTTWTTGVGFFYGTPAWSSGETRTFDFSNGVGQVDETGGQRVWVIDVTQVYSGTTWTMTEFQILDDTSANIALEYQSLVKSSANVSNEVNAFDNVTTGDAFVVGTALSRYVGVDFGRKRNVAGVATISRSNVSFTIQTPAIFDINAGDSTGALSTIFTVDDTSSGDPGANVRRYYPNTG